MERCCKGEKNVSDECQKLWSCRSRDIENVKVWLVFLSFLSTSEISIPCIYQSQNEGLGNTDAKGSSNLWDPASSPNAFVQVHNYVYLICLFHSSNLTSLYILLTGIAPMCRLQNIMVLKSHYLGLTRPFAWPCVA